MPIGTFHCNAQPAISLVGFGVIEGLYRISKGKKTLSIFPVENGNQLVVFREHHFPQAFLSHIARRLPLVVKMIAE